MLKEKKEAGWLSNKSYTETKENHNIIKYTNLPTPFQTGSSTKETTFQYPNKKTYDPRPLPK